MAEPSPQPLALTLKTGLIQTNVGNTRVNLQRVGKADTIAEAILPADQMEHAISLTPKQSGLHRLTLTDGTAGTTLTWPAGTRVVIPAGANETTDLHSRWTMYFYVPKGTKVVAGYADGLGELLDAENKTVLTFNNWPDYFEALVPTGQDGHLWKFSNTLGHRILLTVPPYLARDARELLLPAEVVDRDADD